MKVWGWVKGHLIERDPYDAVDYGMLLLFAVSMTILSAYLI